MNKEIEIGVSLATYLPLSAYNPEKASLRANFIGFDFLQLLPFRFIGKNFSPFLPVKFLERAWNPTTLWSLIRRTVQPDGIPQLPDWLLFPNPAKAEEKFQWLKEKFKPKVISHRLADLLKGEAELLEVSPKIPLSSAALADKVKDCGKCLVLDTYHLRRLPNPNWGESEVMGKNYPVGHIFEKEVLEPLLPFLALVHIQPFRGLIPGQEETETNLLLRDEKIPLLQAVIAGIKRSGYEGPYVVEATLGMGGLNQEKLRWFLRRIRKLIEET